MTTVILLIDHSHPDPDIAGADNRLRFGIAVAYCMLLVAQVSTAQVGALRFDHLTINEGLSQSSANDILQDHRGFIWVATQDGLNRFDGYRFEVMRHDADNPRSLSSNNVSSVYEDSQQTIWVGTTNGTLHRYERQSDSFKRFQLPVKDGASPSSVVFEDIRRVFESTDGRMWIGTRNAGLFEFMRDSGKFIAVTGLSSEKVNSICEGQQGELWIGTDQRGLLWFFPESGEVVSAGHDEQVYPIHRLDSGEIWVAGSAGYVTRYRADRSVIATFSVRLPTGTQNHAARAITQDDDGRVWMGLIGGGLQAFTPEGVRVAAFSHSPSDPLSLSSDTVYSLLYDNAGVLWAGTLAAGLNKANLAGSKFTNYWHRPEDKTSLSHSMANEFEEDSSGAIWVGTSGGGVNRLDPTSHLFTHFRADPDDPEKLASDRIWGMYLESDDDLWVGTWGAGINKLDTRTGRVERYGFGSESPDALPGTIVTAIVGDARGGLWIGMADGGLVRKRPGQAIFDRYNILDASDKFDSTINIASLFRDSRGRIWVGTWTQGLCVLDRQGQAPDCHVYDPSNPSSINDNNIRSITETEDGAIWVATGNGIARFDELTNSFQRFTATHGLVEGVIYGIIPETSRILWLSSNQGLMRFDTRNGSVRKYDYKDGLQSNEFNGGAYLKGSDGTYYFGGIAGISSFRPEELSNNPVPPQTVITRFTLFDDDVPVIPNDENAILRVPVSEARAIQLDYDQNFLGFEFSGLHMVAPALNKYAHMLEGSDRDWVYSDASRRYANYTNLDPGEYVFRVRSANSDGLWSENDAVVAISIAPPWWMTWWARFVAVIALAMSILLVVRWRLSLLQTRTRVLESEVRSRTEQIRLQKETIEEQARHLEEVLEAKNQFFARLSHEFRTPITLMLGPVEEHLRQTASESANKGLSMARRNGRRLLHLVDQLLGLARFGGERPLERHSIAIGPVARFVVESFGVVARARRITLTFEDGGDTWVSSNQDALQTILINLVANAIKYTNAGGSAHVATMKQGAEALLVVSDTGVGIAPVELQHVFNLFERGTAAGEGTGIGLTLVKEVVDAHGGSIRIDSEVGSGTRVEIRMPLAEPPTGEDQPALPEEIPDIDLLLEARAREHNNDRQPDADDPERPSVLLIEDNRDMRQYVCGLLGTDYAFVQAEDGKRGLEVARETIPDLIICDVMMPELDGFEVLAALRDDEHTSHIPVIMLTALGDQASRLKGLEARTDDYISKPFSRAELELKVRNLLELCRLRAQRTGQLLLSGELRQENGDAGELSVRDRRFVARLADVVEARYQDPEFRLATLANAMFMSQRQLQRKMKATLDTVPASYLRNFRLNEARRRLLAGESVSDVTFATGFSSVSYFGKCFKARFGMPPSEVNAK